MNSELPVSADALLAERARLEEVLQSSEDWCELLRLKSRKDRGEGMSAVNAARLEMVLIDALAEDPNFIRYKAVCVALERLIRGLPPLPPKGEKPPVEKDDLTEIDGITASMQRRLNALDVTTFMQIAEWTPADIKSISSDLGIGRQIYEQDWVGQAEELATRSDAPQPAPPPPPKPSAPPKQIAPERPAPPPPPPPRPVETRVTSVEKAPPPPVEREAPRPAVEAKPADVRPSAVKAVETQPEPVAPKFVPPPVAAKTEQKADDVVPEAKAASAATVPVIDKSKSSEPVAVKPEPKADAEAETPPQSAADKSTSPKVETPPAVANGPAPVADPPRPLKPEIYRDATAQSPMAADATAERSSDVATRVLPMPPSPLRVQAPAATSQTVTNKAASPAAPPAELRAPPKPFVITRASLPPLPPTTVAKTQPPPPPSAVQRQAEPSRPTGPPSTGASAGKQDSGPFAALAALKPAAAAPSAAPGQQPSSAPSMSIAEAIAYAAEVARQSPKTTINAPAAPANALGAAPKNTPASVAPPAPPQQKLEPARPPAPAQHMPPAKPPATPVAPPPARAAPPAPAKAAPAKPAIPPPLPEGFVPPPDEAELDQSDYRDGRGQSLRNGARDDNPRQHMHAEEATVEIVVKSAPEIRPTPRATLAKVATETATTAPRPATPIGRFLKALTGN